MKKNKRWWLVSVIGLLLSIAAYALVIPLQIVIGLIVMLLIHEMGHVLAAKRKGLPVSPPLFIPFLGALIMMKRHPRDAATEAYVAFGGPLIGTIGAMVAFWLALQLENTSLLIVANLGFFLNLINLLPIHPLDGGRISVAVSRWLWLVGLVGGLFFVVYLGSLIFFIVWALFAWELFFTFIRKKTKRQSFSAISTFTVPIERLRTSGNLSALAGYALGNPSDDARDGATFGVTPDAAHDDATGNVPDAARDAALDAAPDVVRDAAFDAVPDVARDAALDAAPDVVRDAAPESAFDEKHQRELSFSTFSSWDGEQKVKIYWAALGIEEVIRLPEQGLVKGVHVERIVQTPEHAPDQLVIHVNIEYEAYKSDHYYEVPAHVRWTYGIAYLGLASLLVYMMNITAELQGYRMFF